MFTFALAVFLLIITPGPGVMSLAGVGAAFGWRQGIEYLGGLFIGTNVVCLAVISGLAAIVLADTVIRTFCSPSRRRISLILPSELPLPVPKLPSFQCRGLV